MNKIATDETQKDVIRGFKLNRETLYYTVLFGVGAVISIVLFILGIVFKSAGLMIYTGLITVLFTLAALMTFRLTLISKETLYVENGQLVFKRFFKTDIIAISEIGRVAAVTGLKNDVTTINITYGKNVAKYKFKNFTKEEIAHLRRATSKY